jgi:hypothetical protein
MLYRIVLPGLYVVIRTVKLRIVTVYQHCEMSRDRQIQGVHKPIAEIIILL